MAELKNIVSAKKYKVKDGDSIKSIADKAGISWQELTKFNWGTDDPDKINQFLRIKVGCLNKSEDGKNYVFSSKDDPGIVYLPEELPKKTYSTSATHVVKVKLPEVKIFIPRRMFESTPGQNRTGRGTYTDLTGCAMEIFQFPWLLILGRITNTKISSANIISNRITLKNYLHLNNL